MPIYVFENEKRIVHLVVESIYNIHWCDGLENILRGLVELYMKFATGMPIYGCENENGIMHIVVESIYNIHVMVLRIYREYM